MAERELQQERELGSLEAKIDFLVKNSDETKNDVKELVERVAFQNGRVTSNEKGIAALTAAIETLSRREEQNSTWRKNMIFAGAGLGTLMLVITGVTIPLFISKAKNDVSNIVEDKLNERLPIAIKKAIEESEFIVELN